MSIGDLEDLEIEVDLLSADTIGIAPGTRAHVERWGGEGVIDARVRRIDPSAFTRVSALGIEEQRVRLLLDITSPPEMRAGLGDRYRVYVRIVVWEGQDVLQVPRAALFRLSALPWGAPGSLNHGAAPVPASLLSLLGDPAVLKVGVGVRYDVSAVRTRNPAFDDKGSFVDLEPVLAARWPRLRKLGLRNIYEDTGGVLGRQVTIDCTTGEFEVMQIPRLGGKK